MSLDKNGANVLSNWKKKVSFFSRQIDHRFTPWLLNYHLLLTNYAKTFHFHSYNIIFVKRYFFNLVKVLVCITTEQSHSVVVFCLTAANILSPLNISFDKMLNVQIFISSEYKNTTIICKKKYCVLKNFKYCITFKLSKIS